MLDASMNVALQRQAPSIHGHDRELRVVGASIDVALQRQAPSTHGHDRELRVVGASTNGQFDLGRFRVASVEDHRVPDQPAELSMTDSRELLGHGLLVFGLTQPDLHQLVVAKCGVECSRHACTDTRLADLDDGSQLMRQPAKKFSLISLESHSSPLPQPPETAPVCSSSSVGGVSSSRSSR